MCRDEWSSSETRVNMSPICWIQIFKNKIVQNYLYSRHVCDCCWEYILFKCHNDDESVLYDNDSVIVAY